MICENKRMSSISKKISFHTADYDYSTCLLQIARHKTSVQVNNTLFWDAAPWVCWMCTSAQKENSTFLYGLLPWIWRHQISGSAKSQPQESQISHPNITPIKFSLIYAVQVKLLRDVWQTMACRQYSYLNLWSVIAKAMQHQTLTGGYCSWGYGNIARTREFVSHLRSFCLEFC